MLLLTPGPVQTHPSVRAAMAEDIAPWDAAFRPFYARLRERIRVIAGGVEGEHITLPLQVAGHMIMEAAVRTYVPADSALLIPVNGQYASRAVRLARESGRVVVELPVPDSRGVTPAEIEAALAAHPECGHVVMVYSETGSGIVNDPAAIGPAVRAAGRRMILDAVSAFGALPLDLSAHPEIDAVIFTSNKCLEGLPGFAFAVARIDRTEASAGNAGSWSLDLADVLAISRSHGMGTLRFTGPVQTLRALDVALDRFDAEGGRVPRLARYRANADILYRGLKALELKPYLEDAEQGPIVVTFHQPAGLVLADFVEALKRRGVTISSYFTSYEPSFRIGAIGDVFEADMHKVVQAVKAALDELGLHQAA
ncbi:MAG: 2-aminoethylphosphonate--pyruvate transaminase [Rubritepida sp.]|nr:2-aminoethylphosphonate--pyruvate transaminase [Rubritepida sp.]